MVLTRQIEAKQEKQREAPKLYTGMKSCLLSKPSLILKKKKKKKKNERKHQPNVTKEE